LVRAARQAGLVVVPVPGPSAVAAALSVSGIELTEFAFMGFPPRSGAEREEWMKRLQDEPRTVVFFEAPHRIERTLTELGVLLVNRPIIVNKELTKIHEQLVVYHSGTGVLEGTVAGEYTVIIEPAMTSEGHLDVTDYFSVFCRMTELAGFSEDEAIQMTASLKGTTKTAVRKAVKKARISVKQHTSSTA